jgi:hypothetical protein
VHPLSARLNASRGLCLYCIYGALALGMQTAERHQPIGLAAFYLVAGARNHLNLLFDAPHIDRRSDI